MEQNQELYFNVEKHPLDIEGVDDSLSHLTNMVIGDTPNGRKLLNVCSENYEIVNNKDLIQPMEEIMDNNFKDWEMVPTQEEYARFTFNFLIKDDYFDVGKDEGWNDPLIPKIKLKNSYDGSLKVHFIAGFYRLICENGMTIPAAGFKDKNITKKLMHTPSIIEKERLQRAIDHTKELFDQAHELIAPYKELAEKNVPDVPDRVDEVIEETNVLPKYRDQILNRVYYENENNGVHNSDWSIYNGFNWILNHEPSLSTKQAQKEKLDQKVLNWLYDN